MGYGKNLQFHEGDWVFYNNPGHQFHMSFFQIARIVPMTGLSMGGYDLVYGARSVFAQVDELLHRQDPRVQQNIMNPVIQTPPPALLPLSDYELDIMAKDHWGAVRAHGESDASFRQRLSNYIKGKGPLPLATNAVPADQAYIIQDGRLVGKIENIGTRESHEGHEVIENYAGGKAFKYCRKCKVEVS